MKKLITLVITMVITMSCYAQKDIIITAQSEQVCVWSDASKRFNCWDHIDKQTKFVLKNEIFYINNKFYDAKYTLNGKGRIENCDGFFKIVFENVIDKHNKKCVITIITYNTGRRTMYITYETKEMRYYFNPIN